MEDSFQRKALEEFQRKALEELKKDAAVRQRAQQSRDQFEAKERGAGRGYVRKNVYLCDDCGAGWISADIDRGVTPFMDRCPICEVGMGTSLMYKVPQEILDKKRHLVEWRKPTDKEVRKAGPGVKRHYEQGGLKRVLVSPNDQ